MEPPYGFDSVNYSFPLPRLITYEPKYAEKAGAKPKSMDVKLTPIDYAPNDTVMNLRAIVGARMNQLWGAHFGSQRI